MGNHFSDPEKLNREMRDILLTPIRLNELENLIENSVRKALKDVQPSGTNQDDLLTVQQAAKFLSLAVSTIYSMVSRGELPCMKRTKRIYFSRLDLSLRLLLQRNQDSRSRGASAAFSNRQTPH